MSAMRTSSAKTIYASFFFVGNIFSILAFFRTMLHNSFIYGSKMAKVGKKDIVILLLTYCTKENLS